MIQIFCRKPGFRRAGIEHPATAQYPNSAFTPEQLAELKAEPMLIVTEIPDAASAATGDDAPADKAKGKKV